MRIDKKKIDIILAKKELTKKDLCEMIRMSQVRMQAILNAERLQPKTIGKIAKALNVHVEDIIETKERQENG